MRRPWYRLGAGVCTALLAASLACPLAAHADDRFVIEVIPDSGTLTIVHTNDTHGNYDVQWETSEGAEDSASFYALVRAAANEKGADLLVDAGDTFHGNAFATIARGETVAQLMQGAGYDAMTPGNHDWSYGSERLEELGQNVPVLAGNVVREESGEGFFGDRCVVKEVSIDGNDSPDVTVGIIGVIDDAFYTSTAQGNVEGLSFEDEVGEANELAVELREDEGCDLVIALTHHADPQGFAAQTEGIDAVVAGHEHILINESVRNADGEEVPVVEAGSHLSNIGVLELSLEMNEDEGYDVVGYEEEALDPASLADAAEADADAQEIQSLTDQLEEHAAALLGEECGTSEGTYDYADADFAALEPGGWEKVRTEDTPIGHLVTGSYLAATGADIAFENAGGIRGGIVPGPVTVGDLVSISPYGNALATYALTGQEVLTALEHSLEIMAQSRSVLAKQLEALEAGEDPMQYSWPDNSGDALVVGGLDLTVDWSKPEGERVVSAVLVNTGAELDATAQYTVAMNSFLPGATDEYPAFGTMPLVTEYGTCEEALRALVASDGWEDAVAELTGTVAYVETEEPEPEPEPQPEPEPGEGDEQEPEVKPVPDPGTDAPSDDRLEEDSGAGSTPGSDAQGSSAGGSSPQDGETGGGALPATGDLAVTIAGISGGGVALIAGGALVRRRAARLRRHSRNGSAHGA